MNNYSWLQKKLHQFALSSKLMRETTFDVESSIINTNRYNDDHVFIIGLARSGTTVLLNALYKSDIFASLSYKEMPFALAPNLWSKIYFNKKDIGFVERAHQDGIKVSIESPEAFEEIFWMTFNDSKSDTKEKFKTYVQLINHKYQKERYLSKNNQNIRRLKLISSTFPNSKILIPFRNPTQHAYSLLLQHQRFLDESKKDPFISTYMKLIGHKEFGPSYIPIHSQDLSFADHFDINHWLEQWYLTYQKCFQNINYQKNVQFICYEQLCTSNDYWSDILEMLNIKEFYDYEFKESKKDIFLKIDNDICKLASSLYSKLLESSKIS